MCKNAVEIEAHTDRYVETRRADPNLKEMHILLIAFSVDGGIVPVQLEIKEFLPSANQENKLYVTVTIKTEAGVTPRTAATEIANDNNRSLPASEIRVADLILDVKDNTGDLVKYFPDSMLNEDQRGTKQKAIARDEERLGDMRYEYAVEQGDARVIRMIPVLVRRCTKPDRQHRKRLMKKRLHLRMTSLLRLPISGGKRETAPGNRCCFYI